MKVYSCWDFWMPGILFSSFIIDLLRDGWSKNLLKDVNLNDMFNILGLGEDNDADHTTEDAKMGRRKSRVKAMFDVVEFPVLMLLFFLRSAPLRMIAQWLLSASSLSTPSREHSARQDGKRRYPPACDLVNPVHSVIVATQQYFATLLHSESPLYETFQQYVRASMVDIKWAEDNYRRHP